MQVTFHYSRERDIHCLLIKGKSSNNSQQATKTYLQLVAMFGENPTEQQTNVFIEKYLEDNNIAMEESVISYEEEWNTVASEYTKRAERLFHITLPHDIAGYLTINSRCPYSIQDNLFYIAVPTTSRKRTIMHELWHFYTWYGLGIKEEQRLGKETYNTLKEALTVLLNVECGDLMGESVTDDGYPQHAKLRAEILKFWKKDKDIRKLWNHFSVRGSL